MQLENLSINKILDSIERELRHRQIDNKTRPFYYPSIGGLP